MVGLDLYSTQASYYLPVAMIEVIAMSILIIDTSYCDLMKNVLLQAIVVNGLHKARPSVLIVTQALHVLSTRACQW